MSTKKTVAFRYIFYSLVTAALIFTGYCLEPQESRLFLESWGLWREPLIAGMICGLSSALLGVYIVLNRIVFISLAIAQGASFGIFLSFFIAGLFSVTLSDSPVSLATGLVVALLSALLFAWLRKGRRWPEESLIGLIYVISSGLTILIGDRIAEGHHNIDNLLFGNAVAVGPQELKILAGITLPLVLLHYLFRREFLYGSADPEFMGVKGMNQRAWSLLLYFTLALGITFNLRTLGSLPVFALMVLPPFIALKSARGIREAFWISLLLGVAVPPLGYFYSYLFSFPTGASLIFVAMIYLAASWLETLIFRRKKTPLDLSTIAGSKPST